jgi:hypothetical protein
MLTLLPIVSALLLAGFGAGYGARACISRRRHREAARWRAYGHR